MEINLMDLEPRHAHDFLTSSIIPRPLKKGEVDGKRKKEKEADFVKNLTDSP